MAPAILENQSQEAQDFSLASSYSANSHGAASLHAATIGEDERIQSASLADSPVLSHEDEADFGNSSDESLGLLNGAENTSLQPGGVPHAVTRPWAELHCPKSAYAGHIPPFPVHKERVAIETLLKEKAATGNAKTSEAQEHTEFTLSQFSIYRCDLKGSQHPLEMCGLQFLTQDRYPRLFFDGVLTRGNVQCYVQRVSFQICSIGNYGEDSHTVGSNIWIKSDLNKKTEIYYRLETPSPEYTRYHEGFVWLADFAKHFVDYTSWCSSPVSLHHFRSDFDKWIRKNHKNSSAFDTWYRKYGSHDFRRAVTINVNFLFKECLGIDETLGTHSIWNELRTMDAIPKQAVEENATIVTPYVYECFKHMAFGKFLKAMSPTGLVESLHIGQGAALDLTVANDAFQHPPALSTSATKTVQNHSRLIASIKVGSIVAVKKDEKGVWKDEANPWKVARDCWYICVQRIHLSKNGKHSFDGLWLYEPSDTTCAKMKYPFQNELFLSDNCTCRPGRAFTSKIHEDDILGTIDVLWGGDPAKSADRLVVRLTFLENERFVTFKEAHKTCQHHRNSDGDLCAYSVGQTLLVAPKYASKYALEPFELVDFDADRRFVVLRLLQRRHEVDGRGRPNELVYTDMTDKYPIGKIHAACLVRFFREGEVIPAPYCRDGVGNMFYITTRLVEIHGTQKLEPIGELPRSLLQGFDPLDSPRRPLRGLDLYCGGGNFGRGFEDAGAVHNEWAVDINQNAIYTYNANLKHPGATKLFWGSVNDMLKQAIEGNLKKSDLIPLPRQVEVILAGSPCQGFSLLNSSRDNDKGLRNQSLVASVAAYIDFYRPKYGILENVMNMGQKGANRDNDVLSQLVCAVVGMGYQVQIFLVDAWSCGSPQARTRLFVSFAAPGLEPLEHPILSHSHPPGTRKRSVGTLANGEPFGSRQSDDFTPFNFVTANEATKDLPKIGDGTTLHCTQHPEHVMGSGVSEHMRSKIQAIPKSPRGMTFLKAWKDERLLPGELSLFNNGLSNKGQLAEFASGSSRAYGRVDPNGLFPTIATACHVKDSRAGRTLHWDEDRVLTTMEAKRAQGFPDEEVLVKSPSEGWRILGNSVARTVSTALGLSLREAWLKNAPDADLQLAPVTTANSAQVKKTKNKDTIQGILPSRRFREAFDEEVHAKHAGLIKDLSARSHFAHRQIEEAAIPLRKASVGKKWFTPSLPEEPIHDSNARPALLNPAAVDGHGKLLGFNDRFLATGNSRRSRPLSISSGSDSLKHKRKSSSDNSTPSSHRDKKKPRIESSSRLSSKSLAPASSLAKDLTSDKDSELPLEVSSDSDSSEDPLQDMIEDILSRPPPPRKYVPVDNTAINAFAATNAYMQMAGKGKQGHK